MNRVKLTITDESGTSLCKIGTSIPNPAGKEYSDAELGKLLREMASMLEAVPVIDYDLDKFEQPRIDIGFQSKNIVKVGNGYFTEE